MSYITVENLTYIYGKGTPYEKTALDDVTLSINEGELIGVMGHTGSGKSTLVQHLNGLIRPTSGRITVDGKDIWEEPKKIRDVRFKVGLVFQYPEYQLFDDTCEKDIGFGPRNMGLSDSEIQARVSEAAEMLEISSDILKKSPFDLSGGEKRRVAIAGVIAMRPRVLVLDEPTAGLDPQGRRTVTNLITRYRDVYGASVVFISHSMENIAAAADRVLVMNRGKAVMFDTVPKVFSKADELTRMGLNVPVVTGIFMQLRQRGFEVDPSVFTADAAAAEILRLLKRGEPDA